MAQPTIANSNAHHYVKMLCTTTTKPPSTSKFYLDFKNIFFKDQKIETHLSIFKCFAPCPVDLWAETLQFSVVLPLENTQNFIGCHFFHTHVFPRHSKVQLLKYWGERSFLGIVKSWKVTLKFGRHVENLGDVIIYSVLVEARTGDGYALTFPGYSTITFFFFWMIYYVTFIFSYVQLHNYLELGK